MFRRQSFIYFRHLTKRFYDKIQYNPTLQIKPLIISRISTRPERGIHLTSINAAALDFLNINEDIPENQDDHFKKPNEGDKCPGCGAIFQTQDEAKAGYLVTNMSRLIEEDDKITNSSFENYKRKKAAEQETFDKVFAAMDEENKRLLYPLGIPDAADPENQIIGKIKQQRNPRVFCKRCYNLMHKNRLPSPNWQDALVGSDTSFLKFLAKKPNSIVLTVVDIFDFPGSLLAHLEQLIGTRTRNIIVANKVDILPKDIHYDRIKNWLAFELNGLGFTNVMDIHLTSAVKNIGVRELVNAIADMRSASDDVYLVGCTNVGKSELMNSFLRTSAVGGWQHKVTASLVPGTTMGMLGLPLSIFNGAFGKTLGVKNYFQVSKHIYDTPGIVNESQLLHLLTHEELKLVIPRTKIKPLSYRIEPGKSIFFGGLGRIDYVYGNVPILFTIFSKIPVHITNIARANEFCDNIANGIQQSVIVPPVGPPERILSFPPMKTVRKRILVDGRHGGISVKDIVFSGVGWASISGTFENAELSVHSAGGKGVFLRHHPLLPYEYRGRVEKLLVNKVLVKTNRNNNYGQVHNVRDVRDSRRW
ncbi:5297_t:CDS:2 [Ambispora gerdemannii]|uniref:5297_t:CDS:1 n=1 Tax=Ambispora gerdemannii TaxID=144530 RepID=A0A9N8V142_9GLOM|nr:5297_t:CDS:2 [Ambispora gerdemannii]